MLVFLLQVHNIMVREATKEDTAASNLFVKINTIVRLDYMLSISAQMGSDVETMGGLSSLFSLSTRRHAFLLGTCMLLEIIKQQSTTKIIVALKFREDYAFIRFYSENNSFPNSSSFSNPGGPSSPIRYPVIR